MTSQLSHRGRLPSWNRPGLSRRSGTEVRKLARDQLSPVSQRSSDPEANHRELCHSNSRELARVVQLEKNILFLKKQHDDTLSELHKEIERLRAENRDLNLKLVMCCCGGKIKPVAHRLLKESSANFGKDEVESGASNDELRHIFLEEEVRDLRNKVAIERNKCNRLMKMIEKRVLDRQASSSYETPAEDSSLGLRQQTKGCTSAMARPPTLEECETVIKQLESKTSQQAHELVQIKADLRDVLYSHKWTPDAFLMARAYISDGSHSQEQGFLPPIEPQTSRQTLEKAYQRVKEEVTLPALRPKVPCTVAERHRRAQAIRGRIAKPLF